MTAKDLFAGFLAVLVFGLSGCAMGPQEAPASEQEKNAAMRSYLDCLYRAATRVDDHKSDAATIGLAIQGMCPTEYEITREVYSRGLNPQARQIFYRKNEAHQLQIATEVVLKE